MKLRRRIVRSLLRDRADDNITRDYSRDLRPAECGEKINLRRKNVELPMSLMGHKRTFRMA
jgi:hypothetical protein